MGSGWLLGFILDANVILKKCFFIDRERQRDK